MRYKPHTADMTLTKTTNHLIALSHTNRLLALSINRLPHNPIVRPLPQGSEPTTPYRP